MKAYSVIIGCSRLGAKIACTLSEKGENVTIIDSSEESFRKLSLAYGGLTIQGDGTDLEVLKKAEVNKADAVIIVTNNDNINIMTAQLVKELAPNARVIARLYNPDCECVYQKLSIDTICPSILSANEIDSLLDLPRNEVSA